MTLGNRNPRGSHSKIEIYDGHDEPSNDPDALNYLPTTFEGMMESFGLSLQRKNLYSKLNDSISEMEKGIRCRDYNKDKNLSERAEDVTKDIQNIMKVSIADPGLLKN